MTEAIKILRGAFANEICPIVKNIGVHAVVVKVSSGKEYIYFVEEVER